MWEDVGCGTGTWSVGFGGRTDGTDSGLVAIPWRDCWLGGSRRGLGDGFGTVVEGQVLRMEGVQVVHLYVTFLAVVQSNLVEQS